uniref:Cytochrome b561 domain-containing protein n=1 Tax=Steinernema glaseri TaxID=37863 RepID=A0A1I7Z870_9BILA
MLKIIVGGVFDNPTYKAIIAWSHRFVGPIMLASELYYVYRTPPALLSLACLLLPCLAHSSLRVPRTRSLAVTPPCGFSGEAVAIGYGLSPSLAAGPTLSFCRRDRFNVASSRASVMMSRLSARRVRPPKELRAATHYFVRESFLAAIYLLSRPLARLAASGRWSS